MNNNNKKYLASIITNITLVMAFALSSHTSAAELQHSFNSPAFSGTGYSSHVLTLQQLETQQKEKNKAAADALKAAADAAAANTAQARFQASLESRVYAQLAKQITDSMFGTNGAPSCSSLNPTQSCGNVSIAGNDINWRIGDPSKPSEAGMIVISIMGPTGNVEMKVPSGAFYF